MTKWDLYQECRIDLTFVNQYNSHISKLKKKNRKQLTKSNIHSRFLRKYLSKQGIKGNSKDIREKSIPNIILNDDILNDFSLKSGARKECSLSTPLLFSVEFNVLATSGKKKKGKAS